MSDSQQAASVLLTASPGDSVVFSWMGNHNVYRMTDSASYQACNFTGAVNLGAGSPVSWTVPNSPGAVYYFSCEVGGHCRAGQKLAVTVAAAASSGGSAPAPGPVIGASARIRQVVTVQSISRSSQYTGAVQRVYNTAYAITLGIWDHPNGRYAAGCSVQSTASRRAVTIVFNAQVVGPAAVATADAAAKSLALNSGALTSSFSAARQATGETGVATPSITQVAAPATVPTPVETSSSSDGPSNSFIPVLIVVIVAGLMSPCSLWSL